MEKWKDIYFEENGVEWDFRGIYQVSNFGRVKSLKFGKEKILKQLKDKFGYLSVILCKNGKQKSFRIHRLVAHLFLSDTYFDGAQVNHKDENKQNNYVNNLEWCTHEYNLNYGTRNERAYKTRIRKIAQYDSYYNLIKIWNSAFEVEKELNIDHSMISECCHGKQKTAGGFIWKYIRYIKED